MVVGHGPLWVRVNAWTEIVAIAAFHVFAAHRPFLLCHSQSPSVAPTSRSLPFASSGRGASLLLTFQNTLIEIVDDHPGQPFIMNEQALPDRIGVLFGDFERLLQYL